MSIHVRKIVKWCSRFILFYIFTERYPPLASSGNHHPADDSSNLIQLHIQFRGVIDLVIICLLYIQLIFRYVKYNRLLTKLEFRFMFWKYD